MHEMDVCYRKEKRAIICTLLIMAVGKERHIILLNLQDHVHNASSYERKLKQIKIIHTILQFYLSLCLNRKGGP